MLDHIDIEKVLFLDIETVPAVQNYLSLPEKERKLWDRKAGFLEKEGEADPERIYERAGIYAEFGKIICICIGYVRNGQIRLKSFAGHDEKALLLEFREMLVKHFEKAGFYLCAHNGKEFDFPYIARRMIVNQVKLPSLLDLAGKKPWEVMHLDTMELWKFGDWKSYTSLELLTTILGIPSPKEDIDGSDVGRVYWEENGLDRITAYCLRDVVAIVQVLLRFKGMDIIREEDIISS